MSEKNRIVVPWSGRGSKYTEEEVAIVVEAMQSADPQTQGNHQEHFEKKFTQYIGSQASFAVSSCTAALELSALLCQLQAGDEVIAPAHTYAATVIPFARTGAKIVWADINPDTRLVTAETIKSRINKNTRVIIVVHLYGLVCDMDPILELARERGLLVVEDVAQAMGASYKGKKAGGLGDFGCFSFHSHKNITTLGEGGMLTLKSARHASLIPGLRHNGMRRYPGEREQYWLPAMSEVDFDINGLWPYNFCLGEVQCALGACLLDRLDAVNAERRERAQYFMHSMRDFPELIFQQVPAGCDHVWHLLSARYDGKKYGKTRDDLISLLAFSFGVRVAVQYYPLYRYPMFQKAGLGEADCPNTDQFFDNMISFPFQQWMPEYEFETMVSLVQTTLRQLREGT